MQTVFLHRDASHGMFRLSKGWERTFYFLTDVFQGSSRLGPRAYAHMHRAHHAYSDTEKDPHTPRRFDHVLSMMLDTKHTYHAWVHERTLPERRNIEISRIGWALSYIALYLVFALHPAFLLRFATRDEEPNVLPWDIVTVRELFQNHHQRHGVAEKRRDLRRFRPLLPSRPARFSV